MSRGFRIAFHTIPESALRRHDSDFSDADSAVVPRFNDLSNTDHLAEVTV